MDAKKKRNVALVLAYDGTGFHGWQSQKNAMAIQDILEHAVFRMTGERVTVHGCGRTDAGVHARVYAANFYTDSTVPADRIPLALSAYLKPGIAVLQAFDASYDFHARFSCDKKEYTYYIYNSRVRDPFCARYSYFCPHMIDEDAFIEAASYFEGRHDFNAMRSEGSACRSTTREVYECKASKDGNMFSLSVCADGFLYNMVRRIAGTVLYAGFSKFPPAHIAKILQACDPRASGPVLPAEGLHLTRLWYDNALLGANIYGGETQKFKQNAR